MGCPTEVELGDNLTFSICTHDPDTGVLTDADAVPDYWVYEDETGVSINANTPDEDVMAKLDDAHTTGFYTETLACTTGNGYEVGKTYTVYIEATVSSDKGGISYAFKVATVDAIWDATEAITGQSHSYEYIMAWLYRRFFNEQIITDANGNIQIRNEAENGDIATGNVVDNAGTTTMAAFTIV